MRLSIRRVLLCALFAALMAVCSQLSIPLPMVPSNARLMGTMGSGMDSWEQTAIRAANRAQSSRLRMDRRIYCKPLFIILVVNQYSGFFSPWQVLCPRRCCTHGGPTRAAIFAHQRAGAPWHSGPRPAGCAPCRRELRSLGAWQKFFARPSFISPPDPLWKRRAPFPYSIVNALATACDRYHLFWM